MLASNPTPASPPPTSLLYAGEQFDTDLQQYYLRARFYDPLNGRFNRTDPFTGNTQDPQSLHEYNYTHCNPVNGVDPSGNFCLITQTQTWSTRSELQTSDTWASLSVSDKVTYTLLAALSGYAAYDTMNDLDESLARLPARQEITRFVSEKQTSTKPLVLEEFLELEQRVNQKLPPTYEPKKLYAHYSRKDKTTAVSLVFYGLWDATKLPPDGSFANPFPHIYLTGWDARWYNSMSYTPGAMYVVLPKRGFGPTLGPRLVAPDHGMRGEGIEVAFGRGSGGPGTVFGPIPIPAGQSPLP